MNGSLLSARRGSLPVLLGLLLAVFGVRLVDGQAPSRTADASLTAGVRETRLPNGLRVLTKEVRSAPVVSFGIWYQVGSRNEHNGITGISHLLEHMMFKGTQRYRLGEIARTLFLNGASFNANTFYDWTSYFETLASDRLELAIERVEGKAKLSQNRSEEDQAGVVAGLRAEGSGREATVADQMERLR